MKDLTTPLSAPAARQLMVSALGLDRRPRRAATKQDVLDTIRRMRVLQIDTIHVVAKSPYLVLWSRLGDYETRWLDELLAERRLFEYWAHEASFLPIEDYALFRHRMIDPGSLGWKYSHAWVSKNREQVERVLHAIHERGPLRSADFQRTDGRAGGWWGWKPEKRALEMLLSAGRLMVARRDNFQRVYDLRERVLPEWDDALLPPLHEVNRTLVLRTVAALGIVNARRVPDYFRMPRRETIAIAQDLAAEGALFEVRVAGWKDPAYVHPDNRALLEQAAEGSLRCTLTTFLSPFDPLVWDRARALEVFGFDYRLECYTPARQRSFGYFALPLLRRGQLAGRMDAKAVRKHGEFEVRAFALEPRSRPSAALLADVARALREIASWHGTPHIVLGRGIPAVLRRELIRAVRHQGGHVASARARRISA